MLGLCIMLASAGWLFTLNWKIALAMCLVMLGQGIAKGVDDL